MSSLALKDFFCIVGMPPLITNDFMSVQAPFEKELCLASSKEDLDSILIKLESNYYLDNSSDIRISPLIPVLRSRNKDAVMAIGYSRLEIEISKEWKRKCSSIALNGIFSLNPVVLRLVQEMRPDFSGLLEKVFLHSYKDPQLNDFLHPFIKQYYKKMNWMDWPNSTFEHEFEKLPLNNDDLLNLARNEHWEKLSFALFDKNHLSILPDFKKWELCSCFSQSYQTGKRDLILRELSQKMQNSFLEDFFKSPSNIHRMFLVSVEMSLISKDFQSSIEKGWFNNCDFYGLALNSSGRMAFYFTQRPDEFFAIKNIKSFLKIIPKAERKVWYQNFYEQVSTLLQENTDIPEVNKVIKFRDLHKKMIENEIVSSSRIPFLINSKSSPLLIEFNNLLTKEILGAYSHSLGQFKL